MFLFELFLWVLGYGFCLDAIKIQALFLFVLPFKNLPQFTRRSKSLTYYHLVFFIDYIYFFLFINFNPFSLWITGVSWLKLFWNNFTPKSIKILSINNLVWSEVSGGNWIIEYSVQSSKEWCSCPSGYLWDNVFRVSLA